MGAALGLMLGVGLISLWSAAVTPAHLAVRGNHRMSADRLLAVAVGAVGAGVLVGWLTSDIVAAAVTGLLGSGGVVLARAAGERRRRRALLLAWSVVVDGILGGLQAGLDLREAWAAVVRHAPASLRSEVAVLARDLDLSGDHVRPLLALRERLAEPCTDRVVEALILGLDTGQTVRVLRLLADELRRDAVACSRRSASGAWITAALGMATVAPWAVALGGGVWR